MTNNRHIVPGIKTIVKKTEIKRTNLKTAALVGSLGVGGYLIYRALFGEAPPTPTATGVPSAKFSDFSVLYNGG